MQNPVDITQHKSPLALNSPKCHRKTTGKPEASRDRHIDNYRDDYRKPYQRETEVKHIAVHAPMVTNEADTSLVGTGPNGLT